jgi:uncharacterized membrane protein YhaH (DUF805 family)
LPPERRVMNWTWYLFGFRDRINRAKNWLAALIMLCVMFVFGGLSIGLGQRDRNGAENERWRGW